MSENRKFTLKRKEIKIDLEQEDGSYKEYTIRELSGKGRNEYLEKISARVEKTGSDGKPLALKSFEGPEADLLSLTVFDSSNKLLTKQQVEEWPTTTQEEVYALARDLCGLGLTEEEKAKAKNALKESDTSGSK